MTKNKYSNADSQPGDAVGDLSITEPPQYPRRARRLGRQYDRNLDQVAGLAEGTRCLYGLYVGQFLHWRFSRSSLRLRPLKAEEVNGFIRDRARHLQSSSLHVLTAALRSFLRFLHFTGRTPTPLADAVVSPAPQPRRSIPDTFSEAELRRLLRSFDRTQASGKRDFAIALCLGRLGLRAKEVASLQLTDVDWQAQTLHLQHTKTRRSRLIPLPSDVAAAIQDYVRAGRPPTHCPLLFLRQRAPWVAGHRSGLVREVIRRACRRAGLAPQGVHRLRHTLATRLHRRGVPLKTIADLLGHVALRTTARYAHVHWGELRQAALPWPK